MSRRAEDMPPEMLAEPDDAEIEAIHEAAEDAAVSCIHIAGARNPYTIHDPRAEIWSFAFRQAYARENGY